MNLITEIESYREQLDLSKADMARMFKVPLQNYNNWVYRGSLPKGQFDRAYEILGSNPYQPSDLLMTNKVPLISWVAAGSWCDSPDNYVPGDAEEWLDCPFPFSQSAFCLAVVGDSMWPEYREGEYILVDPGIEEAHGDDIVAREPDGKHTFKRLQITPEGTYLLAINPDHPNRKIEIPPDTQICGVVTGSWMRRR